MNFDEIKNFQGLFLQPNSFELPKGAMEVAENVIIEDKNVISKVRGSYKYYVVGTDEETLGLVTFDDKLIAVYNTRSVFFNNAGGTPNLTGVPVAIPQDTPVQIAYTNVTTPKFTLANANLYANGDDGVLKLSSTDQTVTTSRWYQSGSPPGLDVSFIFGSNNPATFWGTPPPTAASITLGYRVVFGYNDPNNNLILGAPSSDLIISNPIVSAESSAVSAGPGPVDITVDSPSHGLKENQSIKVIAATGFTTDANALSVEPTLIKNVTTNTFDYEVPLTPGPIPAPPATVTYVLAEQPLLSFTIPSQISSNLDTGWFYQIYRSSQVLTGYIFSDYKLIDEQVITADEMTSRIVTYKDNISEINKGAFLYTNENSGEGALQSNHRPPQPQHMSFYQKRMWFANCKPREYLDFAVIDPDDIALTSENAPATYIEIAERIGSVDNFKCRRYYWPTGWQLAKNNGGNPAIEGLLRNNAGLELRATAGYLGLPFRSCVGPIKLYVYNSDPVAGSSPKIYYAGNPFGVPARMTNTTAILYDSVADFVADNASTFTVAATCTYEVISQSVEALTPNLPWTRVGDIISIAVGAGHTYTRGLTFWMQENASATPGGGINDGFYEVDSITATHINIKHTCVDALGTIRYAQHANVVWKNNGAVTAGLKIRDLAEHLVKAINRDTLSDVYAQYTSTAIDNPGFMRLYQKDFTRPISLRVDSDTTSGAFGNQKIPTDYSTGLQVFSSFNTEKNMMYFSKLQEPEAVPIVNYLRVGSANEEILSIHALTNSLIVIKKDGIFRVSGDSPANFVVSLIDPTVVCVARDSAVLFNNQVSMLSNQGVVFISETGVEVKSRNIENVIQYAIDQGGIDISTRGFAYEVDRVYKLTTLDPKGEIVNYNYNVLTDTWTTSYTSFSAAALGPDDKMYYVGYSDSDFSKGTIYKERKDQKKTDFTTEYHNGTILDSTNPDRILISSPSYTIKYGDLIPSIPVVASNKQVNIVKTVEVFAPGQYYCTFFHKTTLATGIVPGNNITIYESFESTIKLAPYTAGTVGLMKQFTQVQIHFRDLATTALQVSFASDSYSNSKANNWIANVEGWSWGTFPWGTKAWGAQEVDFVGADYGQNYATTQSAIARMYVSRLAQRGTFFQPIIKNQIGGDKLNIQSLNVAVRNYGERVSR